MEFLFGFVLLATAGYLGYRTGVETMSRQGPQGRRNHARGNPRRR